MSQVFFGVRVLSGDDAMLWGADEDSKRGIRFYL